MRTRRYGRSPVGRTLANMASRRRLSRILWIAVGITILAVVAYTAYVGYEASRLAVSVDEGRSRDCRTPMTRYGWPYEAINYPIADDEMLAASSGDMTDCTTQGVGAGDAVVTNDGIRIAGWYIPAADGAPPTGPTVVMVHGFGGNKSSNLPYALGLHEHFNIVAFDQRNEGRSGGTSTTGGVLEQNDVRAMIDWVERTKHPEHLGSFGVSLGAAAALAEASQDPRVEAIALDSMHTRIVYQVEQRLKQHKHPPYPGTWAAFLGAWLRSGVWIGDADPADTIGGMGERPIMLTHGTADTEDLPERTQIFYDDAVAAGRNIELHWCEGAGHGKVDDLCGADLAQWLNDFFARTLGD